jgi:DNA-binding MarR family transcriptional regulator
MDRATLISQVLDEVAAHAPFRNMRSMRHWPSGPLSLVHLHVLMQLVEEGPLPMRTLAETLDVSQASATGIVDRMEQRGLVERRRDDEDRRVVRVALTDAGRSLIAGIGAERRGHLAMLLDELSDDDLAAFLRGSRALRRARERFSARQSAQRAPMEPALDPHGTSGATVAGRETNGSTRPVSSPRTTQEASR